MTRMRAWGVAAVLAVILIVAVGWFVALSPQKSKVSDLHSQTAQQNTANDKLRSEIALLKKQQSQTGEQQIEIEKIRERIPDAPQLTTYVKTLNSLAHATHVELISIAPAQPTLVQVSNTTATPSPAASASGAASAAGANLSAISVAVNVVGEYYDVERFLNQLEGTTRLTLVSSVALSPGKLPQPENVAGAAGASGGDSADWKTLSATITASVFMSAASDTGAANGAVAPQPAAPSTSNASPAASPEPTSTAINH